MDRKKELKLQYKQMRPDMGLFIIRSQMNSKCYIEASQNLKGAMNSSQFKLEGNSHPNRELQKEWNEQGAENFMIDILENLEYDKDESKSDYREDLVLLRMTWEEKLIEENMEFYKK
ncbi:GIY-YIG nuclease family protein [Desulfitobacterium metallireducens]|uniref:LuxR family transcriptional regulator n=1 Tax=Desulfitobacterium metallireducens DSM 15288 TaxID=871968 RepID=W0E6H8_9FIRM|nr:GIY-YIG nuclease family protein [Desulfitobacterium metallireducens]AHF06485.1 hypothetical protein DESME_04985 [Desulfitobacterium metallireducens DSM 15288]